MIEVELFDGTILEFPEGTPDDVINRVAMQETMAIQGKQPKADQSIGEMLYENIVGVGEADTPGEKLGQYIRGAGAAVARGIADVPALPANLAQLGAMGVEKLLGMEEPSAVSRALESLPDTREMLASVPVIGPESRYVAPGTAGEYISTIGEFAGGAGASSRLGRIAKSKIAGEATKVKDIGATVGDVMRYGVVPGAASEAAGQATEGTALEPYARTAAGIGASLLATPRPSGVSSRVQQSDPERVAAAESLRRQGIQPTAGQILDVEGLMKAEGTLGPRPAQLDALTKAALRTAGNETAKRATPKVLSDTQRNITSGMNKILDLDVAVSPSAGTRVMQVADDYFAGSPGRELPVALRKVADELVNLATDPASKAIPAKTMRMWRSTLGAYTTSAQELTRDAAHVLREIIDDMTEAALQQAGRADDIAELAKLRQQYRNFLTIADASTRGGREGASGLLTPERLSSASKRVMGRTNYATGKATDLAELARQSEMIVGAVPTVKPGGVRDVATAAGLGSAGAFGGFSAGGPVGAALGGLAGAAAPAVGSALMRSGPVQSAILQPSQFGRSIATVPGLLSQ